MRCRILKTFNQESLFRGLITAVEDVYPGAIAALTRVLMSSAFCTAPDTNHFVAWSDCLHLRKGDDAERLEARKILLQEIVRGIESLLLRHSVRRQDF